MWYYASNGQQQGPVDQAAFDRLVTEGTITSATPVWKEGMADWAPLGEVRPAGGPGVALAPGSAGICSICGQNVGADNLIELLGRPVCAACKPVAIQSLREGVNPAVTGITAWRDGKKVVTYDKSTLPSRCFKCNAATTDAPLKRKLYWHSPHYYWLILLGAVIRIGIFLYVIVALIKRQRATVEVHLCPRHLQRRKYSIAGGWAGAALALILVIVGATQQQTWLMLAGFGLLLASIIGGLIGASVGKASRIKDHVVWMNGAGKELLESLPVWPVDGR
jgi:hypothetical protein